jgi:hypothetical protein
MHRALYSYDPESQSWIALTNMLKSMNSNSLIGLHVSPDSQLFFAPFLLNNQLYYSTDLGESWPMLFESYQGTVQSVCLSEEGAILAGTEGGYLLRTGIDWPVDTIEEDWGFVTQEVPVKRLDTLLRLSDTIAISSVLQGPDKALMIAHCPRSARGYISTGKLDQFLPSFRDIPDQIPFGRILLFFMLAALMPFLVFLLARYVGLKMVLRQMFRKASSVKEEAALATGGTATPAGQPLVQIVKGKSADPKLSKRVGRTLDRSVNLFLIDLIFGLLIIFFVSNLKEKDFLDLVSMFNVEGWVFNTLSVVFLVLTLLIWVVFRKNSLLLQALFVALLIAATYYLFEPNRLYYALIGSIVLYSGWLVSQLIMRERLIRTSSNRPLLILRVFGVFGMQKNILGRLTSAWKYFGSYFTIADPGFVNHQYRLFGPRMFWHGVFLYSVFLIGSVLATMQLDLRMNPGSDLSRLLEGGSASGLGDPAENILYAVSAGSFGEAFASAFSTTNLLFLVVVPALIALLVALIPLFVLVRYQFVSDAKRVQEESVGFAPRSKSGLTYKGKIMYCFDNIWRKALHKMVDRAEVIIMDFRGYSAANRGVIYELLYLINHFPIEKVLFVVPDEKDQTTLTAFREAVQENWSKMAADSPNQSNAEPIIHVLPADANRKDMAVLVSHLIKAGDKN